jgi:hypothetical protein
LNLKNIRFYYQNKSFLSVVCLTDDVALLQKYASKWKAYYYFLGLISRGLKMLSTLHQGVGRVLRASGQAMDNFGQLLEVAPVVEKRKNLLDCFVSFRLGSYNGK